MRIIFNSILCGVISVLFIGCAGSNSSKSLVDKSRALNDDDVEIAAQEIANNISKDDDFIAFQNENKQNDIKTIMLLQKFQDHTGDLSTKGKDGVMKTIFSALEEQFKKNKITFRGSLNQFDADGNSLENYDSSFKEFAAQDRDSRIDGKTGKKIMTNKILNASAGLQIELTKMEKIGDRSTGYVYIIRARLIDGATGTTICTTSKKFTKIPD